MLAPMLILLVLLVLWAGRAGRAGLVADLAAEEAATAAALCCEEGDAEGRERVVEEVLAARPGLDLLCVGGVRPAGDRFVSEVSAYFDPSDGGSTGGVGVLGVGVECETDGAVAPLRGLFPQVTFEGRASEVVQLSSALGASGLPVLMVDDARAAEGSGEVIFDVWLHQAQANDVSAAWWVVEQGGSEATAGVDYAIVSGRVTVFSGDRTTRVRVPLIDDARDEPEESFLLVLGDPAGVSLDRLAATGTIVDDDPPVGIAVVGETVEEGTDGTAVPPGVVEFVVSLDAVSGQVVRFDYETVDGSAVAGEDYEPVSGSVQLYPGVTTSSVPVNLVGDAVHETHEFFSLRVFNVMHALPSSVVAMGSVLDEDPPALWVSHAFVVEGQGPMEFRVGLTALREVSGPVRVRYQTAPGSARSGSVCGPQGVPDPVDFVPISLTDWVDVPVDGSSLVVRVTVCEDGVDDRFGGEETFGLQLFEASGAVLPSVVTNIVADNTGTGTIFDAGVPRLFIDDLRALEGAGVMVFAVRLSHEASVEVAVMARTVAGTATAGGDYSAQSRLVRIPAGVLEEGFRVPLVDDNLQEQPETFTVELSSPSAGADIGDGEGTGTILDDDGPPLVSVAGPVRLNEGETGAFTVSLSWPSASPVVVGFDAIDGSATLGADYTITTRTVTIQPGATTAQIPVRAVADAVDEANEETFRVVLRTASGAILLVPEAQGIIVDADDPPILTLTFDNRVTLNGVDTVTEGTAAEFTLSLRDPDDLTTFRPSGRDITAQVWTQDLTTALAPATAGTDYTPRPQTLAVVFSAGDVVKTVSVATSDDAFDEADVETFQLRVRPVQPPGDTAVQLEAGADRTTVGISDNDDMPEVTVEAVNAKTGASVPSVDEGDVDVEFRVKLSATAGREVRVPVSTADGTAVAGEDYDAVSNQVVIFDVGEDDKPVLVRILDDTAGENDETFTLEVGTPTNATRGDPASAAMTIIDDDLAVSIACGRASCGAIEGDEIEFEVRLNEPAGAGGVTATVSTRDLVVVPDRATAGEDYTALDGTDIHILIGAGQQTATFTVQTTPDTVIEGDERFAVRLVSAAGAAIELPREVTVIIVDDDTTISVSDAEAIEGDDITFTVTLSDTLSDTFGDELDVTVNWAAEAATGPDVATAGADYTDDSGTVTITAGDTEATFTVATGPDALDEADETFTVRLSGQTLGRLATPPTATGTILDDDDPPLLGINNPPAVTEGGRVTFTITLDDPDTPDVGDPSGRAVTFTATTYRLFTVQDPATPGEDYTHRTGTLTIGAGQQTATFTVQTLDDTLDEADIERFGVRLARARRGDAAVAIGDGRGVGGVADNDASVTLAVAAVAAEVTEGDTARFTITLSAASGREVTAHAVTVAGTAAPRTDYRPTSRQVRFPPGATVRTLNIGVPTVDDFTGESDETFSLDLTGTAGAVAQPASATVTIADDDVALSINNATATEGDPLRFLVSLNALTDEAVTVGWATQSPLSGTAATPNADYTPGSGVLTFTPGAQFRTITIQTAEDTDSESDETLLIRLSNPQGADIAENTATGTILDGGHRLLSITGSTATEGNDLTFTLTLDRARNQDTAPSLRSDTGGVLSGVRASPDDYTLPGPASYVIPAGNTSVTFNVPTTQDDLDEPTERLQLLVDAPGGTSFDGNPGVGIIVDDDGTPTVSVTGPSTVNEGDDAVFTVELSAPSGQDTSVYAAVVDGTATAPGDYTVDFGRVYFPAGARLRAVTVATVDDTTVENDETFTLRLSAPHNVSLDTTADAVTTTIADDDTGLSVADAETTEGQDLTFTITLGVPRPTPVTVRYATSDGTATAGTDYTAATGTATIGATRTTTTVTVPTDGDSDAEGYETLQLTLTNPSGGVTIQDATATGTINDDGGRPVISIAPVTVTEGDIAEIVLELDRPSKDPIALSIWTWHTTPIFGRAFPVADYDSANRVVAFPPGETRAVAYVSTVEDELDERDEFFALARTDVKGSAPIAGAARWNIGVTIHDDDPAPVVSVEGPAEVVEGDTALFTLRLTAPSGRPTSVWVETVAGTATAPDDFPSQARRVQFRQVFASPGEAEAVVAVHTADDDVGEPAESFSLRLSSPVSLSEGTMEASVVIVDDDVAVSVGDKEALEGEPLSFEVSLNAPSRQAVTVDWQARVISGTQAAVSADFTEESGTVRLEAGETSAVVDVDTSTDELIEGDERLQLRLSNPAGVLLGDRFGVGTIIDDDTTLSVMAATAAEGVPVRFTVRAGAALSRPFSVSYATEDLAGADAATAGVDYTAQSGRAMFAAGATEVEVAVPTLSDDVEEDEERFRLRLSSPTMGSLDTGATTAAGTIVNADVPVLTVGDAAAVTEGAMAVFPLRLSAASTENVVVSVSTAAPADGEAATPRADFTPLSNQEVTIPAGRTEASVSVQTLGDDLDELDVERFDIVVSLPEDAPVVIVDRPASGEILDDDATPALSIDAPARVTEGATVAVTLRLAAASGRPLVVNYATATAASAPGLLAATPTRVACADVAADARGDFEHAAGSVTIDAGDTTASFTVTTCADETTEADGTAARGGRIEAFALTAQSPAHTTPAHATVEIFDNDLLPTLTISAAEALEGDDLVFELELSHRSELQTRIDRFFGNTALPRVVNMGSGADWTSDFVLVNRPVVFTFPQTTAEFRIQTIRDTQGSDSEREYLGLVVLEAQNIYYDGALGIGTILDRPVNIIVLQPINMYPVEGETVSLTVMLAETRSEDLTLTYWTPAYAVRAHPVNVGQFSTARLPAQAGLDYTPISHSAPARVTIPAGQTSATFSVSVPDDQELETLERFAIKVELPEDATDVAPRYASGLTAHVFITDDEWLSVGMRPGATIVEEGESITVIPTLSWYAMGRTGTPAAFADLVLTVAAIPPVSGSDPPADDSDLTLPAQVSIPAGASTGASFQIQTVEDAVSELTECFVLRVRSVSGVPRDTVLQLPYGLVPYRSTNICIEDDD